jgi:Major Facilitator Superfamily
VAIGPVSGGLLLRHFSWSSVFYVNVPVVVVALAAGARLLPESRDSHAGRFDPLGAVLSVAGTALLVWTVIEAPRHGWISPVTLAGLAGSALILAGFALWQVRRPDPMLDVRVFANARFSAASGAIALAFFGLFGFIFLITQYFQVVRGYDPLRAGVATLPFAVVTGAMSPVAIGVMKRIGTKIVVAGGLACMSAGFVIAAGVGVDSAYWGRIIASMTLMAAGLALASTPATDAIMGAVLPGKAGAGSAVNDTTRELGGTLGVAVVGSVMASVYGAHGALADEPGRPGRRGRRPPVRGRRAHHRRAPAPRPPGPGGAVRTAGVRRRVVRRLAGGGRGHRRSGRRRPGVPPGPRQGNPSISTAAPVLTHGLTGRVPAEDPRLSPAEPPAYREPEAGCPIEDAVEPPKRANP